MRTDPSPDVGKGEVGDCGVSAGRVLTTVLAMAVGLLALVSTARSAKAADMPALKTTVATITVTPSIHGFGTASTAKIVVVDPADHLAMRGTTQFTFDGKPWASRTLDSAGAATLPIATDTSVGLHTIIATFMPGASSGYAGSTGGKAFNVIKARARWVVDVPHTPVYGGSTAINFTLHGAQVSPGTVTLSLDGRVIITQSIPSNGLVPLRPGVSWNAGRQQFTLTYSGNAFNRAETRQLIVTTIKAASTMGLAAPTTLEYLDGGTAQVAVHGAGATPTGTVTLTVDGLPRSTASLSGGHASLSVPALNGGQHTITTVYAGDDNHLAISRTATTVAASSPCPLAARACIDLTHSITWLQTGGTVIYGPVPMQPGRAGHRTNVGMFTVYYKDLDHHSSIYGGASMPYSVFFDDGSAFHEGSLTVQSHGCIHLSQAAASTYFNTLNYGDQVYVFGAAPY